MQGLGASRGMLEQGEAHCLGAHEMMVPEEMSATVREAVEV
jgi:hypothetical protein